MEIYRGLAAGHCGHEELIDFLNYVFGMNGADSGFYRLLPKLYKPENRPEDYNYVVLEDGKLRAAVGAYPIELEVAGHVLRGAGIGSKNFPLLRTEMKDRDGLLLEVESVESAEAEEEVNIRRRRIAFYERCGCEMTKAKSLLYGVDFNILVLPIAQPVPEAKVVLHELENIYHVMFDDELYKRVCHPFIAE